MNKHLTVYFTAESLHSYPNVYSMFIIIISSSSSSIVLEIRADSWWQRIRLLAAASLPVTQCCEMESTSL